MTAKQIIKAIRALTQVLESGSISLSGDDRKIVGRKIIDLISLLS